MSRIFVQIASYRDPDLNNTLNSLFSNAISPENLRVVVANQCKPEDVPVTPRDGVEVHIIPAEQSKGCCFTRNFLQQFYQGEEYILQLDSHMRFAQGWDYILINWMNKLKEKGHTKPLITGYMPSFDPENDPKGRILKPWTMEFDYYNVEGWVSYLPHTIDHPEQHSLPLPARFYSAHFAFADGSFAVEVQHDPEYLFHGEEISISARAYTHGYDLFHPNRVVAWHEYSRKNRTKFWDEHSEWGQLNQKTHRRNKILFGMEPNDEGVNFGKYGFGEVRSLADYEKYAGLRFRDRSAHIETLAKKAPGQNVQSQEEWEADLRCTFVYHINLWRQQLVDFSSDYHFWCVTFQDKDGVEVQREDVGGVMANELIKKTGLSKEKWIVLRRQFTINPNNPPVEWRVWPCANDKGWRHSYIFGKI